MKRASVRTTVDIPAPLYRKLNEQAAAQGRFVRELLLAGVQGVLIPKPPPAAQEGAVSSDSFRRPESAPD